MRRQAPRHRASVYYARALAWSLDGDRPIADITQTARLDSANAQYAAAVKQLQP